LEQEHLVLLLGGDAGAECGGADPGLEQEGVGYGDDQDWRE
jgi:hypothetical protein